MRLDLESTLNLVSVQANIALQNRDFDLFKNYLNKMEDIQRKIKQQERIFQMMDRAVLECIQGLGWNYFSLL